MQLIEARNLTKRFGELTAVDHVDLDVKRGEVVGFLGPNGAGKTTTMRMIAGFLEPDEGTASICGHDIRDDEIEAKRRLGYLPEGAPAYQDMNVAEFLEFIGNMRGLFGADLNDRLAEMVERINLAEVWSKPVETLSKGYKRRVGIAQALLHDPDVLILDEPTDGLDPNQKHEMRGVIRKMSRDKAIIVSTHILEEVEAVCGRAVIIADGRVVADEAPEDLIAKDSEKGALRVTVAGNTNDAVVATLKPFAGDGDIEVLERLNGATRVVLRKSSDNSSAADLAAALAKTELDVVDVGVYRPRLEDVFRKITQQKRN